MDLLDYQVGSPLRLDVFDDSGESIDRVFVSQFEEAIDGYEAYIAVPIVEGVIYAVRVGWSITVYMQAGNNFHRFQARVIQRFQRDGQAYLRILRVSDIEMAQRRRYYRFKCSIPLKYRIIKNINVDLGAPFIDGKTADISGSGLCFISDARLPPDSIIECELLIDGRIVYLVGKIKRCLRVSEDDSDRFSYLIGVYFSEIEEHKREWIIKYIFNEERRLIQAGIA